MLYETITAILLAAHLLLVDVAMAGPIVAMAIAWRPRSVISPEAETIARQTAWLAVGSLVGGALLGVVLLALRWGTSDRSYFAAVSVVPTDRLWFALAEFFFSLVCLTLYAVLWNRLRTRPIVQRLLALAGASNLLMHFPALFSIISIISTRAELAGQTLDRAGFRQMLIDGEVLSRVAHVWLAAFAVAPLAMIALAFRLARRSNTPPNSVLIRRGAQFALTATMLQFPVGIWVAMQVPATSQGALLGGDTLTTCLFGASLLLVMLLMHLLSALALNEPNWRTAHWTLGVMCLLVLLMVGFRQRLTNLAQVIAVSATQQQINQPTEHFTVASGTYLATANLITTDSPHSQRRPYHPWH